MRRHQRPLLHFEEESEYIDYLLSKMRARHVRDILASKLKKKGMISYIGYGKKKPVASNKTKEGRRKNRRVEIIIRPE